MQALLPSLFLLLLHLLLLLLLVHVQRLAQTGARIAAFLAFPLHRPCGVCRRLPRHSYGDFSKRRPRLRGADLNGYLLCSMALLQSDCSLFLALSSAVRPLPGRGACPELDKIREIGEPDLSATWPSLTYRIFCLFPLLRFPARDVAGAGKCGPACPRSDVSCVMWSVFCLP